MDVQLKRCHALLKSPSSSVAKWRWRWEVKQQMLQRGKRGTDSSLCKPSV